MSPHAVVLSGRLGSGHAMMAKAVADTLTSAGWTSDVLDCMDLLGSRGARVGAETFHRMLDIPGLYDALHFGHLRPGTPMALRLDRLATHRLAPGLRRALARRPAQLVVSVFATGAGAAARLKQEDPGRRTVVLCADVAVHRLWVHEGTDLFLVTSEAAAASVHRYLPRAPVTVIAPPVRRSFYSAPSRAVARAALGIAPTSRSALLLDSGWGLGSFVPAAQELAAAGVEVLAVAGHNTALHEELSALAGQWPSVRPFGFTDRVAELMSAADVVVTLPGALSCSEARVMGRRLVLLDVMPGHGRDNLQHELARGGAQVCDPTAKAVTAAVMQMLERAALPAQPVSPVCWDESFRAALDGIGLPLAAPSRRSNGAEDGARHTHEVARRPAPVQLRPITERREEDVDAYAVPTPAIFPGL